MSIECVQFCEWNLFFELYFVLTIWPDHGRPIRSDHFWVMQKTKYVSLFIELELDSFYAFSLSPMWLIEPWAQPSAICFEPKNERSLFRKCNHCLNNCNKNRREKKNSGEKNAREYSLKQTQLEILYWNIEHHRIHHQQQWQRHSEQNEISIE